LLVAEAIMFGWHGHHVKARRVLILVENLPSPFDRRVWQEATTLHAGGYEVSIICPTGKGCEKRYELIDGIHVYRYPLRLEASGPKGYLAEYTAALLWTSVLSVKVFFTRGFDVIHACNPPDLLFLVGAVYKVFLRRKFLFDHHDLSPELYEAKFGRRDFFYKLLRIVEYLSFKTADIAIATNESYKRVAIERGDMDERNVYVVRSGPDLDKWRMMPPRAEHKYGRTYLIGYVGVMGRQEGIHYLLHAARFIVSDMRRTDVHFTLIGGGPMLDEMRALSHKLGIAGHVTFTGRIPDAELLEILNSADVCINPDAANAMNDNSTMNKIMEYMALGKPIVQFDLREGRFSARDASLYTRRNDAIGLARGILTLLADPAMRKRMGKCGRRRVETELEWRYEAPKLLAAYDAVFAFSSGRKRQARDAVTKA
jgi:glycosyltransferase involved in cell wall biosynthesis